MTKKTTPKTKEDNGEYLLNLFNNLNPKTKSTLTTELKKKRKKQIKKEKHYE